MSKSVLALLLAVFCSVPVYAETIEEFYRRFAVAPTADMLHPEGRYAVIVGGQTAAMSATELMTAYQELKTMGVKVEVLELEILGTKETGDIVTVALRARLSQALGSQKTVMDAMGQEILMKKGDSYIWVFSLMRADIK